MDSMTPRRPYLLRAYYEWLLENDLTPHLVVEADLPGVSVPREFVEDGQIVLNIAPRAVGNLELGSEDVRFNARFSGRPFAVEVPVYAVLAIYARENGAGTMFEPEAAYMPHGEEMFEGPDAEGLSVIEALEDQDSAEDPVFEAADGDDDIPPRPPRGRPSLRVVK